MHEEKKKWLEREREREREREIVSTIWLLTTTTTTATTATTTNDNNNNNNSTNNNNNLNKESYSCQFSSRYQWVSGEEQLFSELSWQRWKLHVQLQERIYTWWGWLDL